ncbi:hypothetical protein ABVK25_009368 [Lepraria finkii]|uniref:NWD NACHT-NTPase N-terminal domain-containing protein n=1 Tax=Lepraria finkii TaxID=1340010 RepID=A0ABR4AXL8_9LECA
MVKIINAFRDAGTSAANADPVDAGLQWAGICLLLLPILNNSRQSEALLNGLDLITDMVARHRIIIGPYLTKKPGLEDGIYIINEELRRTTIKLYTIVLEYQAKAAYYINRGTLARVVLNIPKLDDWDAMRRNIIPIESDCREYNFCDYTLKQESSFQTLTTSMEEQKSRLSELIEKKYEN